MTLATTDLYCIQIDLSGQGHDWRTETDVCPDVLAQIEGEIYEAGNDECDDYVACNGLHYRWWPR
jgi:hypothetical protein